MIDVLDVFDGAKNVEFEELMFVEELEEELPVFTLTDIPADEWNRRARAQNTKMFVEIHNREPKNYDEFLSWVYSFIPEHNKNQPTANELALQTKENI